MRRIKKVVVKGVFPNFMLPVPKPAKPIPPEI